ncbi:MAG: STAS domain-containing protein [Terriglobales bacterium]|jgi:anti-sigma B factor antagonist
MKSEKFSDGTLAGASSATEQRNSTGDDKKLKLTLEPGHSGAVVLHCQGRTIFRSEARALSTIVAEVLPASGRMVVNLGEIDFIDSGGLGELVLTQMWAEAAGYSLRLACPQKSLRDLFEITNLTSVFDVYASVPEAIGAMVSDEIHSA